MDTQIIFALSDVGKFILWGAFLAILLYLVFILRRIYIAIKDLTKVVDDNRANIDEILDSAPAITKNFERISKNLADDVSAFNGTVSNVAGFTEKITSMKNLKDKFSKEKETQKNSNNIVIED